MAKRRFGRKPGKKATRKSVRRVGRGHAARVRAGKRSWAAKVRRFGSKAAAIAATFGKRHRVGKKHRKATRKSVRRVGYRPYATKGKVRRALRLPQILREVKYEEGTVGFPVTAGEKNKAEQILFMEQTFKGDRDARSATSRLRESLGEKLKREKEAAAKQLRAIKRREEAAEKAKAEREADKAEIESIARSL